MDRFTASEFLSELVRRAQQGVPTHFSQAATRHQPPSAAISRHQRPSEAINGHPVYHPFVSPLCISPLYQPFVSRFDGNLDPTSQREAVEAAWDPFLRADERDRPPQLLWLLLETTAAEHDPLQVPKSQSQS